MGTATVFTDMQHVKTMRHTPGSALSVDEVALINGRVCVAFADIAASEQGEVIYEADDVEMDVLSTDTFTEGDVVYWDNTNSRLTSTSTSNTKCGMALASKASGVATMRIQLLNSMNL